MTEEFKVEFKLINGQLMPFMEYPEDFLRLLELQDKTLTMILKDGDD